MEIGEKIFKRRKELKLTLEEVGNLVGVGKSTVRKWETGYIENMKRDKIALLAKALQVTPTYLMGWEDENNSELYMSEQIRPISVQKVPLLGNVAAGQPILAQEDFACYVEIGANIKCDFCLHVKGDRKSTRLNSSHT